MEKLKKILTVVLMLYIIIGLFILLYQLLVWHIFPKFFGCSLLFALAALKGCLIGLRHNDSEQQLTKTDRSRLVFLLLLSLVLFCFILFISFLLKGQQNAALICLLTLAASVYCVNLNNPFTDTNP
jgi:hypothetical protein